MMPREIVGSQNTQEIIMKYSLSLSIAMVMVLGLSSFIFAQANTVDLSGTWAFTIQTEAGTGSPTVTLKQDGDKLSGRYSSQVLGEADLTGSVKGKDLTFTFTANMQGTSLQVTCTGTVEDKDTLKGKIDFGSMAQGNWTAKRSSAGGPTPPEGGVPKVGKLDITGTWLFQVETSMGTGNPTMTLKQEGEKLTGRYKGILGEADLDGTLKGTAIAFSFKISAEGTEAMITYTGTVENDAMKGTVRFAGMGEGTFTAKRQ
jgi:hypothetical protein